MAKVSAIGNIVRAGALSALMAGSVAMYSTNPVKTHKSENPPQTEVVSKEGAEAVKAMNFQQQKPTVPTVHNKKLDETLKKFFDKEEDLENIDKTLNNLYNNFGTYMASAIIQQQIDYNMFMLFLNGDVDSLKNFHEYYAKNTKNADCQISTDMQDKIMEWLEPNYNLVMEPVYKSFGHPPEAKELSEAIDEYVTKDPNHIFSKAYFTGNYTNKNKMFLEKIKTASDNEIQIQSSYIAHQINRADILLFERLLRSVGIHMLDKTGGCYYNFMNSATPNVE